MENKNLPKRFLVCPGIVFKPLPSGQPDLCRETLLELLDNEERKHAFVPEYNSYIGIPLEASSEKEIRILFASKQVDEDEVFMIIDNWTAFCHVCNNHTVKEIRDFCLDKFLYRYNRLRSGLKLEKVDIPINGIGKVLLKNTFTKK